MANLSDKDLERYATELSQIPVPKDALQEARMKGYNQYKKQKKSKRRIVQAISVAAILMITFIASIRVSPTFAYAVAQIPGMSGIIDLIAYDKSLNDIMNNEYFEPFNLSDTQNGYTLTLEGVIADETGMVLSYKLSSKKDLSLLTEIDAKVNQNGEPIKAAVGISWAALDKNTYEMNKTIDVTASESIDYAMNNFELMMKLDDAEQTILSIPFHLKNDIKPTKHYTLNKKVKIDGQTIQIDSLNVSPLRAEIKITIDPHNSKQILNIRDIRLLDESGEEWGKILNGTVAFGDFREGTVNIFMQSNYFRKPEKLTIQLGKIEALPKGEDYILVDFNKKEVLYQPDFSKLDINVLNTSELQYTTKSFNTSTALFGSGVDATGKKVYPDSHWSTKSENGHQAGYFYDLTEATNPITIYFESYNSYLNGKADIEVPLK